MKGSSGSWVVALATVVVGALSFSCKDSNDPVNQPLCVQQGPAFRLLVTAPHGLLPRDTEVRVIYQGNLHEEYRLGRRSMNEDLCCHALDVIPTELTSTSCQPDAGAPLNQPAAAIACDVWSNGAAQVTLSAVGYDTTVHDLTAILDEDCETIETSDVTLTLQRGDAGVP
ncbi:MAG TPA: hypothetical protein VHO25_17535 [Polyangiaceae bacterium]|nr:hypothetical protein [Polyangiaceae bacterium]